MSHGFLADSVDANLASLL